MPRKKKVIIISVIICACVVLLLPVPRYYKDGGTVEYNAVLYSVRKEHSISVQGGYYIGTSVRILLWTVYDDVKYVPEEEVRYSWIKSEQSAFLM